MFSLKNYPTIEHHLRSISRIYKSTSGGSWMQIFCPYCNDATRKTNPTHGHCYVASSYPYFLCFRCNTNGSLIKLLVDTGFKDYETIKEIKKFANTNIKYIKSDKVHVQKRNEYELINDYLVFSKQYQDYYQLFLEYIKTRCLHINPIEYYLKPSLYSNKLAVSINNYHLNSCGFRFIGNNLKKRYLYDSRYYYYFQNLLDIIYKRHIIVCEGAFDLINLAHYCRIESVTKRNTFYIAIGGSSFEKCIRFLTAKFLLIGDYTFHLVFDNDYKYRDHTTQRCLKTITELNPNIRLKAYVPIAGKDVSDVTLIQEL